MKAVIHIINGAPVISLFKPSITTESQGDDGATIKVGSSAIFSTWISLKNRIGRQSERKIVVDLSETKFVDHTVMANIEALAKEFAESDRQLLITGLDEHRPLSEHHLAARKKSN